MKPPVLAVDWGTRRLGLAVSDPLGTLARPLPTLQVRGAADAQTQILAALETHEAASVLLGLPLNMDGSEGPSAVRVRALGAALIAAGCRVGYTDERMSSEDAMTFLRERGERRPEKARVDQVAALLLLQAYLDGHAELLDA